MAAASAAAIIALVGCGGQSDGRASAPVTVEGDTTPTNTGGADAADGLVPCIVSLHGKGGDGAPVSTVGGITRLAPRGNAEGWGGRQWDYLDDEAYVAAASVVATSIDGASCTAVAIHGFSNGAAFAAKLYCRGETFGGRVVGIVIDDPVADSATAGCEPDSVVDATLYWTGALESEASAGTDCSGIDWTCEGGVVVGIEAFSASAMLVVTSSPFTEHRRFDDAPDPAMWLGDAGA